MVKTGSGKKIWWLGKCGHKWQATVYDRTTGKGCPICAGKIVLKGFNDLRTLNPELANEWHNNLNDGLTPEMITPNSEKKVWWLGKCGHEWKAIVANRNKGLGCPFCTNRQVLKGFNDLSTTNPELAKQWHYAKNGELTPEMVTMGSGLKIWWLGHCGHEWKSTINSRNQGRGCPICSGRQVLIGKNDLATTNPNLSKEWHPTLNGEITPNMVKAKSNKKVWWLCEYGHEWQATIEKRSRGTKCPICYNKKRLGKSGNCT